MIWDNLNLKRYRMKNPSSEAGAHADCCIAMKVYHQKGECLVAACDADLLGRKLREGKVCLDVLASFYDGERVGEARLVAALRSATIANLVGEACVACARNADLFEGDAAMRICGVPHVQIIRF